MRVSACDVPARSLLDCNLVERAYFRDSYRAPLNRIDLGIADIFLAVFAHHPRWMKLLLIFRHKLAAYAGLDVPAAADVWNVQIKPRYAAGETIGVWPIFAMSEAEIVAGRNNKHMDFRLSVLKAKDGDGDRVIVTTICVVHNLAGKIYLFFVVPFHKYGVRKLLANAVAAGRL